MMRPSYHGWLYMDKPDGITSNHFMIKVRKLLGIKKSGFSGTLDPFATGVLAIALGEATKTIPYLMHKDKSYRFTVKWGQGTDTDDLEGQVIEESNIIPSLEEIAEILPSFTGTITQIPPIYSAIKIQGKRACDLARAGKIVETKPKQVDILDLKILNHEGSETIFDVTCTTGTYVRSLGRDMAHKLGTVGHVKALRRTRVGRIREDMLISLEQLTKILHSSNDVGWLMPIEDVLDDIPAVFLDEQQEFKIRRGQSIEVAHFQYQGTIRLHHENGDLIGMAEAKDETIQPKRLFNCT